MKKHLLISACVATFLSLPFYASAQVETIIEKVQAPDLEKFKIPDFRNDHLSQLALLAFTPELFKTHFANTLSSARHAKNSYLIELQDKTVIATTSKIFLGENNKSYITYEDASESRHSPARFKRIYPSNTKSIARVASDGAILVVGLPVDDNWLFPVTKGRISGYGFLPVFGYPSNSHYHYLQLEGGPVKVFSPETVIAMVKTDPKASKLAEAQKYHEAIVLFNKRAGK
jgi:hypothetical protein